MNKHTNNTITFNTSTNTCFSCGMPVRASTIRKASGGYTSTTTGAGYTYGLGSGITIGSQRDYATNYPGNKYDKWDKMTDEDKELWKQRDKEFMEEGATPPRYVGLGLVSKIETHLHVVSINMYDFLGFYDPEWDGDWDTDLKKIHNYVFKTFPVPYNLTFQFPGTEPEPLTFEHPVYTEKHNDVVFDELFDKLLNWAPLDEEIKEAYHLIIFMRPFDFAEMQSSGCYGGNIGDIPSTKILPNIHSNDNVDKKRVSFNTITKRSFSTKVVTSTKEEQREAVRRTVFNDMYAFMANSKFKANKNMQKGIEEYLEGYDFGDRVIPSIGDIKVTALSSPVGNYIDKNTEMIKAYLKRLLTNDISGDQHLSKVYNVVGKNRLYRIIISMFSQLLSHTNTNDEMSIVTTVNLVVARAIRREYLQQLKGKDKRGFREWKESLKGEEKVISEKLDQDRFLLLIGSKVMEILIHCDILYLDHKKKDNDSLYPRTDYGLTDQKLFAITKDDAIRHTPLKFPMIVPPKEYGQQKLGGYLLNDSYYADELMTQKQSNKESSYILNTPDNLVYHLVNNVSKTPFKINTVLLDYLHSDKGSGLLIQEDQTKVRDSKKLTGSSLKEYHKINSQYAHQQYILHIADLYKNFPSIYFPVKLDQRGRLYCVPPYLNYQSSELSKALLLFSSPGKINKNNLDDISYLTTFGIGCFDPKFTRETPRKRENWLNKHEKNILDYENGILVKKAKEKILFIAFCIEYKRYHNFINDSSQTTFNTYLPVQLDATCNGFQHLALLSQESDLYHELNLTNRDKSNVPRDFYNFLLIKVTNKLKTIACENKTCEQAQTKESYRRLEDFILTRTHMKKIIMTIPYGASEQKMRQYLTEQLEVYYPKDGSKRWFSHSSTPLKGKINDQDVTLLIRTITDIIRIDFPKIDKLMKYLINVAQLLVKLKLPIRWRVPSGLEICQSYIESSKIQIAPFTFRKTKLNLKVWNRDKFDEAKQIRSIIPNLIHSLDAASMTLLYYRFSKMYPDSQFYSVHDCFGTTADKANALKDLLARVYVDLYSTNTYIVEFDKFLISEIDANTNYKWTDRTIHLDSGDYELFDIGWVTDSKPMSLKHVKKIESQFVLI